MKSMSPKTWPFSSQFHTPSHKPAKIAGKAKPGLLIPYHQLWIGGSRPYSSRYVKIAAKGG